MVMTDSAEAVHLRSVDRGELAHRPRLKKQLDGTEHRCPAYGRQFFAEFLDRKAVLLLLQELGNRSPGSSGSTAQLRQHRQKLFVWDHKTTN